VNKLQESQKLTPDEEKLLSSCTTPNDNIPMLPSETMAQGNAKEELPPIRDWQTTKEEFQRKNCELEKIMEKGNNAYYKAQTMYQNPHEEVNNIVNNMSNMTIP